MHVKRYRSVEFLALIHPLRLYVCVIITMEEIMLILTHQGIKSYMHETIAFLHTHYCNPRGLR